MGLTEGAVVTIRHYSMLNLFSGIVNDVKGRSVKIRLPKECKKSVFLAGDPIVTSYVNGSEVLIRGGRVLGFNMAEELLEYSEDEFDEGSKMRAYERFPVSLYADYKITDGFGNTKCFALVKDISDYGLLIYSKESHFKGLKMIMDIYLTRDILSLAAEIARKTEYDGYYEYGLKIRHSGPTVFNHIKNLVKKEQDELFNKFAR